MPSPASLSTRWDFLPGDLGPRAKPVEKAVPTAYQKTLVSPYLSAKERTHKAKMLPFGGPGLQSLESAVNVLAVKDPRRYLSGLLTRCTEVEMPVLRSAQYHNAASDEVRNLRWMVQSQRFTRAVDSRTTNSGCTTVSSDTCSAAILPSRVVAAMAPITRKGWRMVVRRGEIKAAS